MNYQVWKKKHLLVRGGGMGLLGLFKRRSRSDWSVQACDGLGSRSVSAKLERLQRGKKLH